MDFLSGNYNYIIVVAVISWACAQILKTIINAVKTNDFKAERLIGPGGMPSSHTAFVVSAATAVLRVDGIKSTSFAIAFVLAVVVMYDATSVRRHAGYHSKEINKINKYINMKESKEQKESLGHTPVEVLAGACLGILIALLIPIKL